MADKNSALSENFILRLLKDTVEKASEFPFEVISKGGGADLLKTGAITEEERQGFAEQDQANQQILKDYQDRAQAINKLLPQRRQPELKKLYDEIRANTDFDPLTLRDRFKQFRGFYFNDTAAIHDKVARGEVRVKDLRGDDLTNYLFGLFDIADITTLGLTGIATRPLRLAITAFRAGKAGLAKQFLTEAGDEAAQTVSSNVVGGLDKGKMVDQYGVTFQKDDGTGAGGLGSTSPYTDPPSKIGSPEFRQWRTNTARTLFEELRKQKGDPNYKFTKSEAIDELLNLFNTRYPNLPESNRTRVAMMSLLQGREAGKITRPLDEFLITGTGQGGTSPAYFQRFADSNKDLPGTPTYKYLLSMVKKFEAENGFKPTSVQIAKYIQRTGDDEAKSFFAIKETETGIKKGEAGQVNAVIDQNRKQGTEGVDSLLKPAKSGEIKKYIDFKNKSDVFFKSQYDVAIANLNKTDSKFQTIKNEYNTLVKEFTDEFGDPPFTYEQFTRYLRENNLIPKRLLSLEQVNYSPSIKASKEVENAKETVSSMLMSTPNSTEYFKYALNLSPDDDMFRFLQHKYRSLVEDIDAKTLISAEKYMEQYVMPYKGATKEETIANLEKAYPEFKTTWQPMEDKYRLYNDYLDIKMEELAASGKYTEEQLDKIRKSLSPNRAHNFEIKRANLQDRMINASAAGQFIQIQPAYINNSLQPIYDNLLRRIFDNLESAPNINALKDSKIKNIELSKNRQDYSGVNTSVSDYKKMFPDKSKHNQYDYLNYLYKQANEQMKDKGIVSYQIFDPKNKEILKGLKFQDEEFVGPPGGFDFKEVGEVLMIGSRGTYTPEQYIDRALQQLEGGFPSTVNPQNPKSILRFKQSGGLAMSNGGETEQENQSFLSKAATTIGNILIPQAEALPLPKNFLVGDTPKIVKKSDDIKQLTGPEAPLMEKRYNIFDENGNKVYQSKSIDDATQKSLILGEREGKTFTVKEVEVPIKQKKKNITTKPGTSLVPTVTPETIIGSGNNKLYYSDLNDLINAPTLNIKGTNVTSERVSMSAKDWHDWFRSKNIKEGELYDSYVRSYLNKKGGFNRETGKFTNDEKISYAEIKELVDTSPTNYIQSVSYSDVTGTLKYGNSGRHDGYLPGTRVERVLWLDSKDIRGDIGSLPDEVRRYEGHRSMREVQTSPEFSTQGNTLNGEPYVVGWSLNSHRNATLNNRNIKVNVADEIQSDFLQKASSLKANIKREIRNYIQDRPNILPGQSEELDNLYKRLENVFRPMPATYAQLKKSIDALIDSDAVFQKISDMELDDLTKESFKELGEAAKIRDKALAEINATIDNIDVRELFPNIPFKDQKDWVDAIIKNDLYHAAKARFSFDESGKLVVNQDAPAYYAVAPAKAIKAYRGGRGVELPPDNIDRNGTMVAYDMQYGGPNLNDHTGAHFTSNVEETLNKIANMKSSKVEVGKVDFGHAGEAVDTFMIELTPDMLMPYKAYKKDGGLVKKSILYTPIISVNELLSPIGASRW